AAGLGLQVAPIDLFHDDLITKLANLDPETQWPVYLAAVGNVEQNVSL
ncbi:MAG: SagB/ThcOx family dehydrogenase, partial [Methanomicrobiales archaeon]|nr:SagB/ThcOx family dehydrogenase [Methanomicrobiales archaeon]